MSQSDIETDTSVHLQIAIGAAYVGAPVEQKQTLRKRYPDMDPSHACRAFNIARQRHESAWIQRFLDSEDDLLRAAAQAQRHRQQQNAARREQRRVRDEAKVERQAALRARREAIFTALCTEGPLLELKTLTLKQEQKRLSLLQSYCITGRMSGIVEALCRLGVHRACSENVLSAMFFFLEAGNKRIEGIESAAAHLGIPFDTASALIARVIRTFPALREPTEWIETPLDAARRIMSTAVYDQEI